MAREWGDGRIRTIRYRVSFEGDGNVLESDSGNGYTT